MKKSQGSGGNSNQNSNINSNSQSQNNNSKARLSAQNQRKVAQSNTNITHQNSSASTNNNSHQSIQNQEEKKRPQTNADKYKPTQIQNVNNLQRQSVQSVTNLRDKKQLEMQTDQDIYYGDNDDQDDQMTKDHQQEADKQIQLSEDQENIVKLVSGYLVKHGCNRSNEIFLKEIYRPQNPQNKKQMIVNSLMNAFQKGKRDLFFGKWTSFPHNNKPNQIDKLEFYLQIYFLIYEIHPLFKTKDKIGNDRIEYFRSYLDSKGSELSKTTELLTFYALPYIQKPYEHQSFKHLFTQEWVQDLQKKLKSSLDKLINEEDQYCKLEEIYFSGKNKSDQAKQQQQQQAANNQNIPQQQLQQPFYPAPYAPALQQQMNNGQNFNNINSNIQPNNINVSYIQNDISYLPDNSYITDNNSLRANNDQYLKVLQELNSRYSNLHKVYIQVQEQAKQAIMDSHQKWFKLGQDLVYLAKDLIGMVEMSAKGNPPSPQIFESKKKKLGQFEHFLSSNIEDLVQQNQDISLFEKQVSIIEYDQSPIMQQQYKAQQQQQFSGQILNSNLQFDQSPQNLLQAASYDVNMINSRKGQNAYEQMAQIQESHNKQQQIHQHHQQYQMHHQNQQVQYQYPNQHQQQQIEQDNDFQSYAPIDFNKIKLSLKSDTNFQFKISILQALRWRIAKTRNAYQRREVIISYTINDLLGCSKNDTPLQNALFNSPNERLTEFGLRLVNALASDFEGRTYLVESETLVKLLIAILRREGEDSSTRRNALGALQKLSLRKKPQIVMIQNDLIKWIVETLRKEKDQLSEYSYEYATALFMNLSLRSLGRDKCEEEDLRVLEVLQQLLEHENQQVRTFVNGTLYSLLCRPALKEQSRQLSLLQYLVHLRDNSDERFNKQLQYIINQLEKPDEEEEEENASDQEEDNDEDDIEDEEMDDEEEQDEYLDLIEVPGNDEQLIGENLLIQQFSLRGQEALRQHNMTRTALEESKKNAHNQSILNQSRINNRPEPFNRPATPSLSISQISHSQMQGYPDTKRNKNLNNISHQHSQQKQYQQNVYSQQQYQQRDNGEQLNQQQQQLMLLKQKQQMQQQQIQQNQQQQQYINQYQQQQKQNLNQQYNHQSPQMYNDGNNYSQNSSDSKNYIQHQQSAKNTHQNHPPSQHVKTPHNNEIKVSDTKEAFAPRPKIPRTPPSNKDEDSN